MKLKIKDFVVVERHDNGDVNVSYDAKCRSNIYRFLRNLGFCQTKLNGERVYYRRVEDSIYPVDFNVIEDAFFDNLKDDKFGGIPGVESSTIFDLFLIENPIKRYKSFFDELEDELTPEELHQFKMKSDPAYCVKINIEHVHEMLKKYRFNRTVDTAANFSRMSPIYYRQIGLNDYLVFNHYNVNESHLYQGFDCWVAKYEVSMVEDINQKKLIKRSLIKTNFKMPIDFKLIAHYLEN